MTGAQLRFLGAHLAWDLTTDDDPDGERFRAAWQTVQLLESHETQELLWQVLALFADLGHERPDIVVPYIGRLLNEAEEGTP